MSLLLSILAVVIGLHSFTVFNQEPQPKLGVEEPARPTPCRFQSHPPPSRSLHPPDSDRSEKHAERTISAEQSVIDTNDSEPEALAELELQSTRNPLEENDISK